MYVCIFNATFNEYELENDENKRRESQSVPCTTITATLWGKGFLKKETT